MGLCEGGMKSFIILAPEPWTRVRIAYFVGVETASGAAG